MARVALSNSGRTRAQRISAAEGAALVCPATGSSTARALASPIPSTPLAARVAELQDVKIRACLSVRPRAVLEAYPGREHFHWFNWHLPAKTG